MPLALPKPGNPTEPLLLIYFGGDIYAKGRLSFRIVFTSKVIRLLNT
jgi:hypothetical protein